MKRFAVLLVALMALCAPAHAQMSTLGAGSSGPIWAPGCSQSATYFAALSGLNVTERNAYDAAICGIVADGNWTGVMVGFYIFANANVANAKVNAVSPGTLNITSHGTVVFTVDQGFASDGTTGYLDAGFIPSTNGGHFARNSASIGVCNASVRTTTSAMTSFGVNDGTQQTYFIPWFGANTALGAINSTGPGAGLTPLAGASSTVGNWILSRTAAGGWVTYLNGVVSFTVASDASIGLPSLTLPALAFNTSGTISNWSTDLHAYWFFGGGLTSTQAGQVNVRLHTMLVALGFFVC